jgi:ubiquitin carboxyl-terminal hydrolase L3
MEGKVANNSWVRPCVAPTSEKAKDDEAAKIAAEGQTQSDKVYYMRQTVGNACGTVGILHAVGNNLERFGIAPGSYFNEFFAKTASLTPAERATYLEEDEGIEVAHGDAVVGGQSSVPDIDAVINLHFVALVCVDGGLYELDGRKSLPVYHGVTSEATLLTDAVPVINTFVENAEGSIHFNAIALSKSVE